MRLMFRSGYGNVEGRLEFKIVRVDPLVLCLQLGEDPVLVLESLAVGLEIISRGCIKNETSKTLKSPSSYFKIKYLFLLISYHLK